MKRNVRKERKMKQAKLIGTSTALAKNTVPFDEINDVSGAV